MSPTRTTSETAPVEALRLDRQLCFALYGAANRMQRLYRPLLDALGLTYPQYLAMLALWEQSPRSVGALGEALDLDSSTLTPLLKRLEAAGLVSRTRDPQDERRVIVTLTDAGAALRDRALTVPEQIFCQVGLPLDELTALRDKLKTVAS
ncbi:MULTISPECIES: MarR family winged helix-turn-helix transcriptional regulator [unclassified Caulobacter]|uniref:MarR family winged helix-turn-helix transcriptional regulator n=1 Tax=unclassified Caulobacter TaxID=2648921 RepID=UPI000D3C6C71|nr:MULTISPECIES: MarR family transcriptional regulator [unclassified Caulobacter]PTS89368.1 MarR family transcriptional regulator [Caulobacter sp. HMWF009]PTT04898.1 MarR family transcriptional regulator [Caulobacter sp. HMWF025]